MQTRNIKLINIELLFTLPISFGKNGYCFKKDDETLVKIFHHFKFDNDEMFEFLNELETFKNDSFVIPKEILIKKDKIVGYTEDYINAKCLNRIRGNIYQLFDNGIFEKLVSDTKEVSEKGLSFKDVHYKNILFNENGYYMIDLDHFKIDKNPITNLFNYNMNDIMNAIIYSIFKIERCDTFAFCNSKLFDLNRKKSSDYRYFYDLIEELIKNSNSEKISLIRRRTKYESYFNSYTKLF